MSEGGPPAAGGKVLRRSNSNRLRMHAPSSIQVAPPTGCASEWKVAIPLLSPLDICTLPGQIEVAATEKHRQVTGGGDAQVTADLRRRAWRHPAEPFYYEPAPSNAPAFAVSHGAAS